MTRITSTERFDDVAPENPNGTVDYAYHGFTYVIAVDECVFRVGTYDYRPGVAIVIDPADARTRPEARALVDFITSTTNCTSIHFYCGPVGAYRSVDIRTLEFT